MFEIESGVGLRRTWGWGRGRGRHEEGEDIYKVVI
jgi:hypothetical protein